ncbi:MAG: hypothetical protein AAB681_01520, partial [Patescibacteria group bacterium]
ECLLFKKDSTKRLRGGNNMKASELETILVSGALEIQIRHRSISKMKDVFRKKLPKSDPSLLFSKITRYVNNGMMDEFWYEGTGKEIKDLFDGFDPEIIASLLSITSIRATVTSNATKFFKALQQFYENKIYTVLVGNRKNRKKMNSAFRGFLDASLYHLNSLKNGKSMIDPAHRLVNGRKIKNFTDAMLSGVEAIVDDVWITRAFGCDRKRVFRSRTTSQSPTKAIYDATEWYLQTVAHLVGKKGRGLCAMIWSGVRQEKSKSSTRYTEALRKRLDHGLFVGHYGKLMISEKGGIEFESL